MAAVKWTLILHGGAKEIPAEKVQRNRDGCRRAIEAGVAVLREAGSALDAVELTIRSLEDDPVFNAGYGSVLNTDGKVQTDAGIMDGRTLDVGAVAALERIRNPIRVARSLLRHRHVLLASEGALRFARASGIPECSEEDLISAERREAPNEWGLDTVGCVALDAHENIVAATSTGGLPGKLPGRVGDSPLPGSGFYADDHCGGVCFSGDGESIMRVALSSAVMTNLETQSPQAAIDNALKRMSRVGGAAGGIVLNKFGDLGWAHNTAHFAVAYMNSAMVSPCVYLSKQEERNGDIHAGP